MFSNIPIEEGLEAFKEQLDKMEDKTIPTEFILKLLKLVLEKNIFEFEREFYIQLLGTAMGTRVAPTYSLPLDNLETSEAFFAGQKSI